MMIRRIDAHSEEWPCPFCGQPILLIDWHPKSWCSHCKFWVDQMSARFPNSTKLAPNDRDPEADLHRLEKLGYVDNPFPAQVKPW